MRKVFRILSSVLCKKNKFYIAFFKLRQNSYHIKLTILKGTIKWHLYTFRARRGGSHL